MDLHDNRLMDSGEASMLVFLLQYKQHKLKPTIQTPTNNTKFNQQYKLQPTINFTNNKSQTDQNPGQMLLPEILEIFPTYWKPTPKFPKNVPPCRDGFISSFIATKWLMGICH